MTKTIYEQQRQKRIQRAINRIRGKSTVEVSRENDTLVIEHPAAGSEVATEKFTVRQKLKNGTTKTHKIDAFSVYDVLMQYPYKLK